MNMNRYRLSIIGLGNMGEAILRGVLSSGVYKPSEVSGIDINKTRLDHIASTYHISVHDDLKEVVESSDMLLIAIKPGGMKDLIRHISPLIGNENLVLISIAAGITIKQIKEWLDRKVQIIRIMPNTPLIIGEGAIAISPDDDTSNESIEQVRSLFETMGKTVVIDEKYMNIVTALSGSGPAYIFTIVEALADGAVMLGLPRKEALLLAAQTTLGAAKMVLQSEEHPAVLRNRVTSPGGTTARGLFILESAGIRGILMDTVEEAKKRADELEKEV